MPIVPSTYEHKNIEELEKIAPGIINFMTGLVLFEHKDEGTFRKLSKGTGEFLSKSIQEYCSVHVPQEVANDPSPNFECYVMRYYNNGTATAYKFLIDSLTT